MLPFVVEIDIVLLLLLAIIVAIIVRRIKFPYTLALVVLGFFVTLLKVETIPLSKEVILFLFLPPLLFEGAVHLQFDNLRENIKTISLLAVVGVLVSTALIGLGVHWILGIPLLYGLLLGAIVSPTDPVSVLALFKKLGVSKKLSVIVEGESLFNDGTGVVVFEIILGLILMHEFSIAASVLHFFKVVLGGVLIGVIAGMLVYSLMKRIDDHLIEVMSTIVLAYGSFLLAEYFAVSGVIAVVSGGLLIGNYGKRFAMSPKTHLSIVNFWEIVVFIVNSIIFIMIGATIPIRGLISHLWMILVAIVVTLVARSISVYGLSTLTNFFKEPTPFRWQHIINWGGLRGSIPIALVLGIQTLDIPYKDQITYMAFGVVFFSLIVQGLTIGPLIKKLKIIRIDISEEKAEKMLAKKAAIKKAIKELHRAHDEGEISSAVHKKLTDNYRKELLAIKKSYEDHVKNKKVLRLKREKQARKRALTAEKAAIMNQSLKGLISQDSKEDLIKEIDEELKELD